MSGGKGRRLGFKAYTEDDIWRPGSEAKFERKDRRGRLNADSTWSCRRRLEA